jgi:predicted DNA-binding transcriptional regulator AlpA
MKLKALIPIREQLTRIEKKIDGQFTDKYLDINQVSSLTSLSLSTLRRRVSLGELKCTRRLGKLLFKQSAVEDWLNG